MPFTDPKYDPYSTQYDPNAPNNTTADDWASQNEAPNGGQWNNKRIGGVMAYDPFSTLKYPGYEPGSFGDSVNGVLDPRGMAAMDYWASGMPTEIAGADFYQQSAQKMAQAGPRANPYNPQLQAMADRTRPQLQGVYGQMMQQANGPSIASMQAQGAQGSNLQAALGARGNNAGVAMQAGQGGAGIAQGAATLGAQQQAQQFAGAGALAGGMRGRDINQAQNVTEAALQQRQLDNAQRQFYAQQGSRLSNSQDQAALNDYKFKQALYLQRQKKAQQDVATGAGVVGTVVKAIAAA